MFSCDKVVIIKNAGDPAPQAFVHLSESVQLEMKLGDFIRLVKKELKHPSPFLSKAIDRVLSKMRDAAQQAVDENA